MQLEALKIFCDVVKWASFSRGAAENHMSQSSASQAVHNLEERLGVKLIDRSKRPLVLTSHGKVYYEGCKELVDRYFEVENRVKALVNEHRVTGTVRVASIYSIGLHHMQRYVETFEARYPEAEVRLEYLHPSRVIESVRQEEADLGLISFPKKWAGLTVRAWREEPMVLAVAPSHRFAGRPEIEVGELEGETFVGFTTDLAIRRAIDRYLRRHHVHVELALEFDNIEHIKRAVEIASGVAILPEPTLDHEVKSGSLAAVRFHDASLTRPLAVVHRRGDAPSLPASRFLDLLMGEDVARSEEVGTGSSPSPAALSSNGRGASPPASDRHRRMPSKTA